LNISEYLESLLCKEKSNELIPIEYISELPEPIEEFVKHQGHTPYCQAYALSYLFEIQQFMKGEAKKVSPEFLIMCNNPEKRDLRTKPIVFRNCVDYGYVFEEDFDHGFETTSLNYPTYAKLEPLYLTQKDELLEKASKNKCLTWYNMFYNTLGTLKPKPRRVKDIKAAIVKYGGVQLSFQIYENFYDRVDNIYIPDSTYDSNHFISGHALLLIGWTKYGQWIFINSWGNLFGYNGLGLLPENIMFGEVNCLVPNHADKITFNVAYDKTYTSESEINSIMNFYNYLEDPIFDTFSTLKLEENVFIPVHSQKFETYAEALNFVYLKNYDKNTNIYILPSFIEYKYKLIFDIIINDEATANVYIEILNDDFGFNCEYKDGLILLGKYETEIEAQNKLNSIININPNLNGIVKIVN